ncbi:hypothetical protein AVEN_57177-1 [Araneus ventricosus]|uniref:Uncharacterized protein n=1 Tax=Araneus ventricosus TaxID=182803 RepID=A0A4Y2K3U3_ARAVE|nr:hypothetical protein AVEN_57177-1 [Araneus ventricosus]
MAGCCSKRREKVVGRVVIKETFKEEMKGLPLISPTTRSEEKRGKVADESIPQISYYCEYLFTIPNASGLLLTYLELYSRTPLLTFLWWHPPSQSWYRSEGPGSTIHFKGDRKDQTALSRLKSGLFKILRFSRGDKKFNICTKCNMIGATPQHLLDCAALVYDDLLKRPGFVLKVMKANDLMDLI